MCAVYATFRSPMLPKQAQTAKFRGIISTLAQWLACWAHNPKVRGSKPRRTSYFLSFPPPRTYAKAEQLELCKGRRPREVSNVHNDCSPSVCPWRIPLMLNAKFVRNAMSQHVPAVMARFQDTRLCTTCPEEGFCN